jgi:ribosomal-protein-alanine N-acetyltransferase
MTAPLETLHLTLIPCSPQHLLGLIQEPQRFAELTGFPAADGLREFFIRLQQSSGSDPWPHGFFVVERETRTAIGMAAFKGPPDPAGLVEIAYAIVPAYEGRGYATEAARALVEFAFASDQVRVVRAHTLPVSNASTRVLQKCGFYHAEDVVDPKDGPVWRWERPRDSPQGERQPALPDERYPTLVGLGTLLTLHALLILGPIQGMTSLKGAAEPLFIGVVQLWYVLPLLILFLVVGWRRTAKVFAIGAIVTFLLNLVACGVFIHILSGIGK